MNSIKKFLRQYLILTDTIYNKIVLKYRRVSYGRCLKISGKVFCVSNRADGIIIGDYVIINSCRRANPIGGDTKTILFAKENGKIKIGNYVGMSNVTLFATESITIGDHVLLGGNVKVYDTDFHDLYYDKRVSSGGGLSKPVEIKEGAFVGAHTIILKGVTIGEKSIVGAGSVVTKSIPKGEIWAGNPAKFIRRND